jgi:hypothetical protein
MSSCKDRRKLAEQFAVAARQHSEAVARLVLHEGTSSDVEYGSLRKVMIEAQYCCDSAGVEFEQHVAAHGCGVFTKESRVPASTHVTASAGA